jgi:hypothetical protein
VLKWILIAGDAKATMMIVGTFPEAASPDVGETIRKSVLTASWSTAPPADSFEGLPFRLTATASLKLARRVLQHADVHGIGNDRIARID